MRFICSRVLPFCLSLAALVCVIGAQGRGKDPSTKIRERIAQFQSKESPVPLLTVAHDALGRNHSLYSLWVLRQVIPAVASQRSYDANQAMTSQDEAVMHAYVDKAAAKLDRRIEELKKDFTNQPLAARAIGRMLWNESKNYLESGRVYGAETQHASGAAYADTALASVETAIFTRDLKLPRPKKQPKIRSVTPELDLFDPIALRAFADATAENNTRFMIMNQFLKQAREMEEKEWHEGALMAYLDAVYVLGRVQGPLLKAEEITAKLDAFEKRLSADVDHSIGKVYVELGREALIAGNMDQASSAVVHVLPRYLAYVSEPAPVSPPVKKPRVRLTLVRWPYT